SAAAGVRPGRRDARARRLLALRRGDAAHGGAARLRPGAAQARRGVVPRPTADRLPLPRGRAGAGRREQPALQLQSLFRARRQPVRAVLDAGVGPRAGGPAGEGGEGAGTPGLRVAVRRATPRRRGCGAAEGERGPDLRADGARAGGVAGVGPAAGEGADRPGEAARRPAAGDALRGQGLPARRRVHARGDEMNRTTTMDPRWAWQPYRPSAESPWDLKKVGHLYRRAGFGATWTELH